MKAMKAKQYSGYNVRLHKSEVIQNPIKIRMKNGMFAIKGHGSDGTTIHRFLGKNPNL